MNTLKLEGIDILLILDKIYVT